MRSSITGALVLAATAAVIAACGGDEEAGNGDDDLGGSGSDARQTIKVTAKDFSFTPGKLSGEVGEPLDLVLTNSGDAPHTFTIDEFDVDAEVAVGEQATLFVTPSAPGEFKYYCRFHEAQGMRGAITITAEGGAGASPAGPGSSPVDTDDGYGGY